jgi:hypothetical protein
MIFESNDFARGAALPKVVPLKSRFVRLCFLGD